MVSESNDRIYDLAIIGGGVNGCGIARDAAGRGLDIVVFEQGDLAQATSSASTKLFHGGLRYLEYYEFRLVREALLEREVLLRAMPHISWPMRFILPHKKGMRPAWLLRLGLFIYDHLGGRKILPPTKTIDLRTDPLGAPLAPGFDKGFEYSDCWVEDARLVVLNARDAATLGADIRPHTRCVAAERDGDLWSVTVEDAASGERQRVRARGVINAAGPWVDEVLTQRLRRNAPAHIRLVRGSHIVTRKLFDHDRAYIFQTQDGRIVFAIPYEHDFTLVGTTDLEHEGSPADAVCTPAEETYLRTAVSAYFKHQVAPDDVVWTYSGVRPLYDDGASSATAATRDYVLEVDDVDGKAPVLNIFGGKITTYRRLAEAALGKLQTYFPKMRAPWTKAAPLPGGDFPHDAVPTLATELCKDYPFLDEAWALRLVRAYGTDVMEILSGAKTIESLGQHFGWNLTEAEVRWLMTKEWARDADDVLWRRSKLGLRLSHAEAQSLDRWMREQAPALAAE